MPAVHLTIALDGLSCGGGGVLAIERELKRIPGVSRVYANPATEMAYIDCDPETVDKYLLSSAVKRAGFRAGEINVR